MEEPGSTARGDGRMVGFVVGVAVTVAAASVIWATNTSSTEVEVVGSEAVATSTPPAALTTSPTAPVGSSDTTVPDERNQPVAQHQQVTGPEPASATPSQASPSAGSGEPMPTTSPKLPAADGVKGVTDDKIWLGFQTADAAAFNAAAAALGLGDATFDESVDGKALRRAVIDYVNNHGGLGGRTVEEVTYEILASDAVTPEGRAKSAQEGCAKYTEDNEVFAFADGGGMWTEDNINQCAADHQTLFLQLNLVGAVVDTKRYSEITPYYLTPNRLMANAHDRAMVDQLAATGLLPTDAKVALMIDEAGASRRAADAALKPALKRHGIEIVEEAVYPDVIEAPWDTYVLQFRRAGATHVVFGTSSYGFWPIQNMLRAAENQAWYPEWRGSSEIVAAGQQATAPAAQLPFIAGVGFMPAADLGEEGNADDFYPESPRCRAAMREAGIDEDEAENATLICHYLFLLKDGFDQATELSAAGLHDGLVRHGEGLYPKLAETLRFRPGRPDGAGSLRPFAWDTDCECYQYVGPATPVD